MDEGSSFLTLQNIEKGFDGTPVLRGISLDVARGEFITLLGPSGCGKTTTLRIIAGLEAPDAGRVILEGQDVTELAPEKRPVNTVFQNYALFPHMNVAANIGYGLKLRRTPKAEIAQRTQEMLALVQLSGFERRMPSELSGGQKQRVAIARSLITNPKVLLLDEPLGALDLQLRRQMQLELKHMQKQLGITFIYITHDQEEALNMSDRIAVMRDGVFEQVGTPAEVYDRPRTAFAATFVGSANIVRGTVAAQQGDALTVTVNGGQVPALANGGAFAPGAPIALAVRSEQVLLHKCTHENKGLCAAITEKSFAGGMLRIALKLLDGTDVVASRHGINIDFGIGDEVCVSWEPEHAVPVADDGFCTGGVQRAAAAPASMDASDRPAAPAPAPEARA